MRPSNLNLAALIGSRICHDLISPIGAINNGLELLGMTAPTEGPEFELISQSVGNASARIRFFRIAYGAASVQLVGRAEIVSILADVMGGAGWKWLGDRWMVSRARWCDWRSSRYNALKTQCLMVGALK